jgi:hypothetical protein
MEEQEVSYMAQSDERLVGALYELAAQVDDEELTQEFEAALGEVFERAMPEALKRDTWQMFQESEPEDAAREMDAFLAALESRAAFRPLARQLAES